MKTNGFLAACLCVFAFAVCALADIGKLSLIEKIANANSGLFESKGFLVNECVQYTPEHLSLLKKNPDFNGQLLKRTYKIFKKGDNIFFEETRKNAKSINTRTAYMSKTDIAVIDSINDIILIDDIKNAGEYGSYVPNPHLYSVFYILKDALLGAKEKFDFKIGETEYIFSWESNGQKNMLFVDKKELRVVKFETYNANGVLTCENKIDYALDKITQKIKYIKSEKDFVVFNIELFAQDDAEFYLQPENFGYKFVYDKRSGQLRAYIAVDNLPTKIFIDDLFENKDDVYRYNKEMTRFAPVMRECKK